MKHRFVTTRRMAPIGLCLLASLFTACSEESEDRTGASVAALCDDGNPCTFDTWGFRGCLHNPMAAGTACSLDSFCGAPGTCNRSGACQATTPLCDDHNACTSDACTNVGRTWVCQRTNRPQGTTCNDGSVCTHSDACNSRGSCTGIAAAIDDGNPCTSDTCDPTAGIKHTPRANGSSCEDGNLCNGAETCSAGRCVTGSAPAVDDQNPCTTDTCDPATGVRHTPVADGTSCVDNDVCNGTETCSSGVCKSGAPLDCDDHNVCTGDSCHPGLGCRHSQTVCTDGSVCTVDLCDPILGCTFTPINCSDNDACTSDSCDDANGCRHEALSCNDGDLCTTDACDSATGCFYVAKSCNDGNACTSDECDAQTGTCEYEARTNEPCNDNDTCTATDRCDAAGTCQGVTVNPDDGDPCTTDACDGLAGITHEPVEVGGWCSDGDPSNGMEVCNATGACVTLPQSESVVDRVGGEDPEVWERQLGRGRHPVAASEDGLAVAFYEVLKSGAARVAVATYSSLGEGRGLWRANASVLDLDPVVSAVPGGFVVAYQDLLADSDGLDVVLVRLDAHGQQLSSAQIANGTTPYGQHSPDLVWHGDRLWVSWEDDFALLGEGGRRICLRSFSDGLVPTGEETCDAGVGQNRGRVAWAAANGGPARAWRKEAGGAGSIEINWAGALHSLPLEVLPPAAETPALAALDASHVLLVYTDGYGDQKAAVMGDTGSLAGPWLLNPQPQAARFEPSVAVTDDGVYLAWREPADDTQGWTEYLDDTYYQKLSWNGVSLSGEAPWPLPHDSLFALGDQRRPAVSSVPVTASGALWAAWDDLREGQAGPEHGDVRVSLMPTPVVRPGLAM